MSTYLELCQGVERESGTFPSPLSSVVSQTGRHLKVVHWTKQAWLDIQNMRGSWRWMRREFTGALTSGTARYTASSFSLSDFGAWIVETDPEEGGNFSIYETALTVTDEGIIPAIPYLEWRNRYGRGAATTSTYYNRPSEFAVSPTNELCFGPIPDDAYTVRGEYRQASVELSANADTPAMPTRFHKLIEWKALEYLNQDGEAVQNVALATANFNRMFGDLMRDQLPSFTLGGGPLA